MPIRYRFAVLLSLLFAACAITSDKRLGCFGVPESLLFEIKLGHCYQLQVTAAASSEPDLQIAQAAK